MPHRVTQLLIGQLLGQFLAELPVFIDRARNHANVQAFGALGLAEQVKAQAFFAAVSQPLIDRQPIALGFGNLLAVLVEEQLVNHSLGRTAAKRAGNLAALRHAVSQILAAHFVIDAERDPAHCPIDLPLQLGLPAEDRLLDRLALVLEAHDPSFSIDHFDRHLQDNAAGRADRQHRRIGRGAFGPQRRQHDRLNRVITAQHILQGGIKPARIVQLA